ncbi:MAG TPA: hypothetical protein VFP05_05790 [Thermomicrobiales bacterium]|jgi:hypothetical protein|nr:hypothetical protein [Thermomicrobiales bacterium]
MEEQQIAPPGTMVYDASGEPLGTVESSGPSSMVVVSSDGPTEFDVPIDVVFETRADGMYLSVTREDLLNRGKGEVPVDGDTVEIPGDLDT